MLFKRNIKHFVRACIIVTNNHPKCFFPHTSNSMTNMSFAPPALVARNYSRTIAILSFLILTRSSDVKGRYTVHLIINTSSQWPCPRTWNTRPRTPVTAISLDERHTGVHNLDTSLSCGRRNWSERSTNMLSEAPSMPRHVVELAEAVYGGESASIGTRDSSSGPEISYIEVFPPTKSWESTSKHSRDMQIFSPHCTCLFSSPQDQLDASSKVKEVYDTGLYRLPLYLQYGRSCFQALELSKGTKSRPAYPSLVLIQTMTKLCYRQSSTSLLWLVSALTLRQLLHSSLIKVHICKKVGSRCSRRVTGYASSRSPPTQAGSTAM